nr:hypothetical protein [Tanacetum cinerariifolium]
KGNGSIDQVVVRGEPDLRLMGKIQRIHIPPVDAKNWISHMEKIFDVMGCEDVYKTRLAVYKFEGNALAWWKAYKQAKGGDAWLVTTNTETSMEFMQRFLRLVGFLGAAGGTEEEQAKNFQWGKSFQAEEWQRSGDRHQPTSQQSSHRSHGYHNDRHGSDRRGGSDNHRSSNNNYSGSNNRNSGYGRDQRNRGHQSNRFANSGECRRAAGTCFKCGQAGQLQKDCKKNTTASTSG